MTSFGIYVIFFLFPDAFFGPFSSIDIKTIIAVYKSYYIAKPVSRKSVRSDWFFLGRDFAVRSKPCMFWSKAGKFKICNQNSEKKMWILSFFIAKLPEKAKKIEFLLRFQRYRWMKKTNIFRARSGLIWCRNETGIAESHKAKDDFINQQKTFIQHFGLRAREYQSSDPLLFSTSPVLNIGSISRCTFQTSHGNVEIVQNERKRRIIIDSDEDDWLWTYVC